MGVTEKFPQEVENRSIRWPLDADREYAFFPIFGILETTLMKEVRFVFTM